MATIDGPKIQMPQALSALITESGEPSIEMASFMSAVQSIAFYSTRSGPTGSRPTASSFRWVGMPFLDTTLGKPIWLKTASSNAWIDATGSAV